MCSHPARLADVRTLFFLLDAQVLTEKYQRDRMDHRLPTAFRVYYHPCWFPAQRIFLGSNIYIHTHPPHLTLHLLGLHQQACVVEVRD